MSEKRKREAAAKFAAEQAAEADGTGGSPSSGTATRAEQAQWDSKYDAQWNDIHAGVDEFHQSWGNDEV